MEIQGEIGLTYTGGVLKPDEGLNLPEGAHVRALIFSDVPDKAAAAEALEVLRRIGESGAFRSRGERLTRDEMHERN